MKTLFVYTDINTMGLGAKTFHFGISMISAVLKQNGHQTDIVCMYDALQLKRFFKKIKAFKPDILAFTSDTTQFGYIKKILQKVANLDIFTILGGAHASLCPSCLEETTGLDAVCLGEGEYSMLDLVNNFEKKPNKYAVENIWFKTNNGVIKNRLRPFIENLDKLPFADRDIFNFQKIIDSDYGRVPFMLSRGCPYACTYCASPSMGKLQEGKYVRFMSIERAIKELKSIKDRYKFKSIFFADDIFTLDKNYVDKFCEQYKKEVDVPFEANSRIETSSYEIFKTLKDAGCFKIHIGIESGDEDFRKNKLNRNMSNKQIIDAFYMARKAGLQTKSYNIVGFPCETPEIHKKTVRINQEIMPDGHVCYIFQPYPGTKLNDVCKERGFIQNNVNKKTTISRRETILNMPDFIPQEIIKAHRNFSFEIYRNTSFAKALIYKIYYSQYGEILLRILSPIKNTLKKLIMK
ncbi:MAG: radical SAM protein [bacterium]